MKIAIGSDHGGFVLKQVVAQTVRELGHEVVDLGTHSTDSVDYPQYAGAVCDTVAGNKADRGILICGTGIGMSMAANRNPAIRAAVCQDSYTARMSREHNDANVLCIGERVVGVGLAQDIVQTWLATDFASGRHLNRIRMF